MANEEHLQIVRQGVKTWNEWREKNPELDRDLRNAVLNDINLLGANLSGANLSEANLDGVDLSEANLIDANLTRANLYKAGLGEANLYKANFTGANLTEANLSMAGLFGTDLREANLTGARLIGANLSGANLSGANLSGTRLIRANLTGANLNGANLSEAQLIRTNLCNTTLTGCAVYGASVWDVTVNDQTNQNNLIITPSGEAAITIDNIKVAQFIYLLLNNQEIREVIDTITSKAVLILGRFSEERKPVLNALRGALRNKGFLPIVFDFERPKDRDFTETIMTLAGMSCFVIADITKPKSVPLELQTTVPDYMIPFVPILQDGEPAFSMFLNLQTKYHWVLDVLGYNSSETLVEVLDEAVINPALKKRYELEQEKMKHRPMRHVDDYRNPPPH